MDPVVVDFLNDLKQNNNREWFNSNKEFYLRAKKIFDDFVDDLIAGVETFDPSLRGLNSKSCVYRIYRDVRFSRDKTPYKKYFSAYIASNGGRKSSLAGYYIHIEPGNCLAGGGLHCPKPELLKEVRFEIYNQPEQFKNILENSRFSKTFGTVTGDSLIRPPKGFPKEFRYMQWIKQKEYLVGHGFPEAFTSDDGFLPYLLDVFKTMKPFIDFLNHPLIA